MTAVNASTGSESQTSRSIDAFGVFIALGWVDIVEGYFSPVLISKELLQSNELTGCNADVVLSESGTITIYYPTLRVCRSNNLIGLKIAGGMNLLGRIANSRRKSDGWEIGVQILGDRYRVVRVLSAQEKWSNECLEIEYAIAYFPRVTLGSALSLIIKATRVGGENFVVPNLIKLDGYGLMDVGECVQYGSFWACSLLSTSRVVK